MSNNSSNFPDEDLVSKIDTSEGKTNDIITKKLDLLLQLMINLKSTFYSIKFYYREYYLFNLQAKITSYWC